MRVSDLVAVKGHDVASISQERSVTDALALLNQHHIGALVVTGIGSPLVGIMSERDVVRALAARGASILERSVAELMSRTVTTCHGDTTVTALMQIMTDQRIRHVPVVDGDRVVAMVSIGDVVKARLGELEHDKKELLDYVSSW